MTVVSGPNPVHALRYCREVTKRRARNFYYGLRLLPEPQRSALYAVYAWMRQADDLVDDAGVDLAEVRDDIDAFGRATEAALAGEVAGNDPVLIGLRESARRFPLVMEPFRAMLDGQLDDVAGCRYDDFASLRGYCERVASSVGLICITIWGYDDDRAPALATERGIALQLTNILRDFVEDDEAGRVYLPAEDFARHGLTPEGLRSWSDPEAAREFVLEQIVRAESFYRSSAPLDAMITPACRPTLWAMTRIYRGLLAQMAADPARLVSGPRIRLTALNKGTIAISARFRAGGARIGRP